MNEFYKLDVPDYAWIKQPGEVSYPVNDYSIFTPESKKPEVPNPLTIPLVVTWQENGQIQFRGCKDYEELKEVFKKNLGKPYLKCAKSVVLNYDEVCDLAYAEKIEKEEKAQREADEKEYQRLKEKLGYTDFATKSAF